MVAACTRGPVQDEKGERAEKWLAYEIEDSGADDNEAPGDEECGEVSGEKGKM